MDFQQLNLEAFRPGVYLHYKGNLFEADHLVRNSSEEGRVEIHYIGLQLTGASEGPRYLTREFGEFLEDKVHEDGSKCEHEATSTPDICNAEKHIIPRFRYLGPVYEHRMLDEQP